MKRGKQQQPQERQRQNGTAQGEQIRNAGSPIQIKRPGSPLNGGPREATAISNQRHFPTALIHQLGEPLLDKLSHSFGDDFPEVKIHENSQTAASMKVRAFVRGNDVHFAPGQFSPNTTIGQKLIGHEFAHVMQQRMDGPPARYAEAESQAHQVGALAAMGWPIGGSMLSSPFGAIQRSDWDPDTPVHSQEYVTVDGSQYLRSTVSLKIDVDGDGNKELALAATYEGSQVSLLFTPTHGNSMALTLSDAATIFKSPHLFTVYKQFPSELTNGFRIQFRGGAVMSLWYGGPTDDGGELLNIGYYTDERLTKLLRKDSIQFRGNISGNGKRSSLKARENGTETWGSVSSVVAESHGNLGTDFVYIQDEPYGDNLFLRFLKVEGEGNNYKIGVEMGAFDENYRVFQVHHHSVPLALSTTPFEDLKFTVLDASSKYRVQVSSETVDVDLLELGISHMNRLNEEYDPTVGNNGPQYLPSREERHIKMQTRNLETLKVNEGVFKITGTVADRNKKVQQGDFNRSSHARLKLYTRLDAIAKFQQAPPAKTVEEMVEGNLDFRAMQLWRQLATLEQPKGIVQLQSGIDLVDIAKAWTELMPLLSSPIDQISFEATRDLVGAFNGNLLTPEDAYREINYPAPGTNPMALATNTFLAAVWRVYVSNMRLFSIPNGVPIEIRGSASLLNSTMATYLEKFEEQLTDIFNFQAATDLQGRTMRLIQLEIDTMRMVMDLTQSIPNLGAGNPIWSEFRETVRQSRVITEKLNEVKGDNSGRVGRMIPVKARFYPLHDNNALEVKSVPIQLFIYETTKVIQGRLSSRTRFNWNIVGLGKEDLHYEGYSESSEGKSIEEVFEMHHKQVMAEVNDSDFLPQGILEYEIDNGRDRVLTGQVEINGDNDDSLIPTWASVGVTLLAIGATVMTWGVAGPALFAIAGGINATNSIYKVYNSYSEGRGFDWKDVSMAAVDVITNICDWTGTIHAIRGLKAATIVTHGGKVYKAIKVADFAADAFGFILFQASAYDEYDKYLKACHEQGISPDPFAFWKLLTFGILNGSLGIYTGVTKYKEIAEWGNMEQTRKQLFHSNPGRSNDELTGFNAYNQQHPKGSFKDYLDSTPASTLTTGSQAQLKRLDDTQAYHNWAKSHPEKTLADYNASAGQNLSKADIDHYAAVMDDAKLTFGVRNMPVPDGVHPQIKSLIDEHHKKGGSWLDDEFLGFAKSQAQLLKDPNLAKAIGAFEKEQLACKSLVLSYVTKYGADSFAEMAPALAQGSWSLNGLKLWGKELKIADSELRDLDQLTDLLHLSSLYKGDKTRFMFDLDLLNKSLTSGVMSPSTKLKAMLSFEGDFLNHHSLKAKNLKLMPTELHEQMKDAERNLNTAIATTDRIQQLSKKAQQQVLDGKFFEEAELVSLISSNNVLKMKQLQDSSKGLEQAMEQFVEPKLIADYAKNVLRLKPGTLRHKRLISDGTKFIRAKATAAFALQKQAVDLQNELEFVGKSLRKAQLQALTGSLIGGNELETLTLLFIQKSVKLDQLTDELSRQFKALENVLNGTGTLPGKPRYLNPGITPNKKTNWWNTKNYAQVKQYENQNILSEIATHNGLGTPSTGYLNRLNVSKEEVSDFLGRNKLVADKFDELSLQSVSQEFHRDDARLMSLYTRIKGKVETQEQQLTETYRQIDLELNQLGMLKPALVKGKAAGQSYDQDWNNGQKMDLNYDESVGIQVSPRNVDDLKSLEKELSLSLPGWKAAEKRIGDANARNVASFQLKEALLKELNQKISVLRKELDALESISLAYRLKDTFSQDDPLKSLFLYIQELTNLWDEESVKEVIERSDYSNLKAIFDPE